jgi:DNA processing protein
MEELKKKYLNALNLLFASPDSVSKILKSYSPEKGFKLTAEELKNLGFKEKTVSNFIKKRSTIDPDYEWKKLEKLGVKLITFDEREYPPLLKEIPNPPVALYLKGSLLPEEKYFAVVGPRYPSDYGKLVAKEIVPELSLAFTIVSGLARGIDGLAQKLALNENQRTVAVLGSGLDIIYPPENKTLAQKIEQNGALISEFPLGTPPKAYHFPLRNRIMAGMSLGTLVVEAKKKSGALITALLALEYGREVFAVPGSIFSKTSEGTNFLIKEGAYLTRSANDIFEKFDLKLWAKKKKEVKFQSEEEKIIFEALKEGALTVDEIVKKTNLSCDKVTSTLIMMEIENKVKRSQNKYSL